MKQRRWKLFPEIDQEILQEFAPWGPVMAQILSNRGIRSQEEARAFLDPQAKDLSDPLLLLDIDKAVARILRAVENGEQIFIYGDYDVDGVCSTAMLYELLNSAGAQVSYYIPDRAEEGYGLNKTAMKQIIEQGAKLILTVDCGISSPAEIELANSAGVDVVITDHHHVPQEKPAAYAIINPHQPGCSSNFKELAGVGVAYKLVQALQQKSTFDTDHDFLDLVALGTVADVVPLIGENRILVSLGLGVLNKTSRPGLKALIKECDCQNGVQAYHLGFQLGPRLNAAGRMTHASDALDLLLATDDVAAQKAAAKLSSLNASRQDLTASIFGKIRDQVESSEVDKEIILASSRDWPAGIVGLVASKVCEEYYKPTLIVEKGEHMSRGSARSIAGFNITEALTRCSHLLSRFGGHAMAAGFEIGSENLAELEKCLSESARMALSAEDRIPTLSIDAKISLDDVNYQTYKQLAKLAPHGYRNPRPVFLAESLRPVSLSLVGKDRDHIRFALQSKQSRMTGIGFGLGELMPELNGQDSIDMVFGIDENNWQGLTKLQLKAKDIRVTGS